MVASYTDWACMPKISATSGTVMSADLLPLVLVTVSHLVETAGHQGENQRECPLRRTAALSRPRLFHSITTFSRDVPSQV